MTAVTLVGLVPWVLRSRLTLDKDNPLLAHGAPLVLDGGYEPLPLSIGNSFFGAGWYPNFAECLWKRK